MSKVPRADEPATPIATAGDGANETGMGRRKCAECVRLRKQIADMKVAAAPFVAIVSEALDYGDRMRRHSEVRNG